MLKAIKITTLLVLLLLVISCSSDQDELIKQEELRQVRILLTDDPTDLVAVNLELKSIVLGGDQSTEIGTDIKFNLLDYQDGQTLTLLDKELPVSEFSSIQLVLGEKNSVETEIEEFPLLIPTGHLDQLNLTFKDLEAEKDLEILIDFDAAASVHELDNGTWVLDPVMKIVKLNGEKMDDELLAFPADKRAELEAEREGSEVVRIEERTYCFHDETLLYVAFQSPGLDFLEEGLYDDDCQLVYKIDRFDYTSDDLALRVIQQYIDEPFDIYRELTSYRALSEIIYGTEVMIQGKDEFVSMYFTENEGKICEE